MANQKIIIKKTVQYKDDKGNNVTVLPDSEPQSVPADVAKDCLARGWGKKPEKAAKKAVAADSDDSTTGDDDTSDTQQ